MAIGIVELGHRRAAVLAVRAAKKLKDLRKETRAAMQRYEGVSDLSEDDKTTYDDLTLSMVILNALSDQLLRLHVLPRKWDVLTLGSNFNQHLTPVLRKNDQGELWVEYFDFACPKDALILIAGEIAKAIPEDAPAMPQRHKLRRPPAPSPAPAASDPKPAETSMMDLIRARMPQVSTVSYRPKRG